MKLNIILLLILGFVSTASADGSRRPKNINFTVCSSDNNSVKVFIGRTSESIGYGDYTAVDYLEVVTAENHWFATNAGAPTQWINLDGEYAKITSELDGSFTLKTYKNEDGPQFKVNIEVEVLQKLGGDISIKDSSTGNWLLPYTKLNCNPGQ